jgi:predicted nuclease of predicted toxin-antitoxin system
MKILLDECMPQRLPQGILSKHEIVHVRDLGWQSIQNGELLSKANGQFDILLTIDKNMPFQQSLKGLIICVAVLDVVEPSKEIFAQFLGAFESQIHELSPGSFNTVSLVP